MRPILSIFFIIWFFSHPAQTQTGDGYLKTELDGLQQQLDSFVSQAPPSVKASQLSYAHYWYHAVGAYTSLGTLNPYDKLDKVGTTEMELLKELQTEVSSFVNHKKPATEAPKLAKQYIEKLPVVKNQFVVEPIMPILHYQGSTQSIQLVIKGSFALLLQDANEVFIYSGTQKVGYSHATDTSITFNFAPAQLGLHELQPLLTQKVQLHLTGQVGRKVNKKKQFVATYHFYVMALPASPGKLTVTLSNTSKSTERQSKRTRTFLLNGSKGNLVEKQCLPSHDGWVLIPESVDLVVESSAGQKKRDWNFRKTTTGGKTCYTTEVFFNSAGPSGKLEYHIKYELKRSSTEEFTETQEVNLDWGKDKQIIFDLPITQVAFTDFLGKTTIVEGTNLFSQWLQLEVQEKSLAIKTTEYTAPNIVP